MIAQIVMAAVAAAPAALPGGTVATDIKVGGGAAATAGQRVAMFYTGWLYENGVRGTRFDSEQSEPFRFTLGAGEVIAGWDEGVAGMRVGGKRTLIIPPAQGYGDAGAGGVIPPGATLMFDVELLAIE